MQGKSRKRRGLLVHILLARQKPRIALRADSHSFTIHPLLTLMMQAKCIERKRSPRCGVFEDDMRGDSATHHVMAKTSLSHPPELLSVHRVISAVLSQTQSHTWVSGYTRRPYSRSAPPNFYGYITGRQNDHLVIFHGSIQEHDFFKGLWFQTPG